MEAENKLIELEYLFETTPSLVWDRISNLLGLSMWFAPKVEESSDGRLSFYWQDYRMDAKLTKDDSNYYLRLEWCDEPNKITEMSLSYSELGKNTALKIRETISEDESEEEIELLWDEMIKRLKLILGLPPKIIKI